MSPRRARRRTEEARPLITTTIATPEEHVDGEWFVRRIGGGASAKAYRCPGCDQLIAAGLAHVVTWRPGDEGGRRHWHSPCWAARLRRRPR